MCTIEPSCKYPAHFKTLLRKCISRMQRYPDRAPLKEVLGGQYNYREGGRQVLRQGAVGVEIVCVVRIRAPKR